MLSSKVGGITELANEGAKKGGLLYSNNEQGNPFGFEIRVRHRQSDISESCLMFPTCLLKFCAIETTLVTCVLSRPMHAACFTSSLVFLALKTADLACFLRKEHQASSGNSVHSDAPVF